MFDPTSRYKELKVKTLNITESAGETRQIRYAERRFLPAAGTSTTLVEHTVVQGDRLDNITAKYLGDPTQFWRVADANDTSHPEELTNDIGRTIVIALPH